MFYESNFPMDRMFNVKGGKVHDDGTRCKPVCNAQCKAGELLNTIVRVEEYLLVSSTEDDRIYIDITQIEYEGETS